MTGTRNGKVTGDVFCRAALAMLADDGSEGLTIAALCERVGITKGSFYHHFEDLAGFRARLLQFWESEHSDRPIALLTALPMTVDRLTSLIHHALELPHATEAALRAWARSDAGVLEVVTRVDRQRERYVLETLTGLGIPVAQARPLTRLGLDALVGRQMRQRRVDIEEMRENFEELRRLTFGTTGLL